MPELINLVRPDGSILQTTPDKAAPLLAAGYKEEDVQSRTDRAAQAANEAYYSSGGQRIKTAVEGLGSGLTLGLSDKMLQGMEDAGLTNRDWRERAGYNPGTRMASELTGEILPALLSGGESLAIKGAGELVPAAGLTNIAARAGEAVGGSAAKRLAVQGAIEGAGWGFGQEVRSTALNGDPLTVEGSLAAMGWGAIWGGGTGGTIGAIGSKLEGRIAAREAAKGVGLEEGVHDLAYKELSSTLRDAGRGTQDVFKAAEKDIDLAHESLKASRATSLKTTEAMQTEGQAALREAAEIRGTYFNEMTVNGMDKYAKAEKLAGIEAFNRMKSALKSKDWGELEAASQKFQEKVKAIADKRNEFSYLTTAEEPKIPGTFTQKAVEQDPQHAARLETATRALKDLKDVGVASSHLKNIPLTTEEFMRMTPARMERLGAGIDTFLSHPAAEFAGRQEAIKDAIGNFASHVGLTVEGDASTQLRGIWETMRNAQKASVEGQVEGAIKSGQPLWKKGAQYGAGIGVAKATHSGWLGYIMGKNLVSGLLGMKGAITGKVSQLVDSWGPGLMKAASVTAPKIDPLMVRLDGTIDKGNTERKDLMKARAEEIRNAAPNLNDTLYRAITPLDGAHPEFAAALHETAIKQFQFLLDKLPKDPPNSFSRLESLHRTSALETEQFARYYRAFQDPIGVINDALSGKRISSEEAEGLREMSTAIFGYMRQMMIEKISDPKVRDNLDYQEQVHLGNLLHLPLHASMTASFIAQQQAMYQERNQPLKSMGIPPQPGVGNGAGRPGGKGNPMMSKSQAISNH